MCSVWWYGYSYYCSLFRWQIGGSLWVTWFELCVGHYRYWVSLFQCFWINFCGGFRFESILKLIVKFFMLFLISFWTFRSIFAIQFGFDHIYIGWICWIFAYQMDSHQSISIEMSIQHLPRIRNKIEKKSLVSSVKRIVYLSMSKFLLGYSYLCIVNTQSTIKYQSTTCMWSKRNETFQISLDIFSSEKRLPIIAKIIDPKWSQSKFR